jgi:hypothetical protein
MMLGLNDLVIMKITGSRLVKAAARRCKVNLDK